jgi:hypothetical protein
MQSKDDDQNLDNSEFQISIFILLIRFNHSTCNACPIHPHKIKSSPTTAGYTQSVAKSRSTDGF